MENLEKWALVTGATSGIAYELAGLLAKDRHNLVIVARCQESLDAAADELQRKYNISVIKIAKDLSHPNNAFALYEDIRHRGLRIDIVVNDAGQGQYGLFQVTDIRKELAIVQLNIASLVVLSKLYLKDMLAKGSGKILILSSMAGKMPGSLLSVYQGAKAFIQSFTESLQEEVRAGGVNIAALLPELKSISFFNNEEIQDVLENDWSDITKVAAMGYSALMNNDDVMMNNYKNNMQVA